MKKVISNYQDFTEEFNLLGRIAIGTVTVLILACCIAMAIGLLMQGAPGSIGYLN